MNLIPLKPPYTTTSCCLLNKKDAQAIQKVAFNTKITQFKNKNPVNNQIKGWTKMNLNYSGLKAYVKIHLDVISQI